MKRRQIAERKKKKRKNKGDEKGKLRLAGIKHKTEKKEKSRYIPEEKTYLKRKELISMYNALDIAKYVVIKCMNDGHPITNLYLQKLLFYIQREYLISVDEPLFRDSFEAWSFGPVVPKVYYRYCGFGGNEIDFLIDTTIPKIDRKDKKNN